MEFPELPVRVPGPGGVPRRLPVGLPSLPLRALLAAALQSLHPILGQIELLLRVRGDPHLRELPRS